MQRKRLCCSKFKCNGVSTVLIRKEDSQEFELEDQRQLTTKLLKEPRAMQALA